MPKQKKRKFIFVVGGVMSGVGKGITSASLGLILKSKGYKVTALKIDPYVNVDAGTMNPIEHGEVFVTNDGDETDQDMGNYERFLDIDLGSENYMTTGRIYMNVIENERAMKYKGKCVQVVPHIPMEVIKRIRTAAENHDADVTIIEIGGTVGEYENILFLEAARMMRLKDPKSVAIVLVSFMPVPHHIGEMKTKPTQHAARSLYSAGLNADMIFARGPEPLDKPRREKLALHCGIDPKNCISAPDVDSIYEIPINFEKENVGNKVLKILGLAAKKTDLSDWEKKVIEKLKNGKKQLDIAVIGKYFGTGNYTLSDSYISVIEAIKHAAWANSAKVNLEWIDSEKYEKNKKKTTELLKYDGIIVPGGFGTRGVEGIINSIQFARENKIPFLGLCYGMQLASIEFVRNVLMKKDATSAEINPESKEAVIHININQAENIKGNRYGGTMRLGAYNCKINKNSKTFDAYKKEEISERHRHRYEFNNDYRDEMDKAGLKVVGINPESDLVEIVELENHPFFIGVQFHPEFKSRPINPHPLFNHFIKIALENSHK